MFRAGPAIALAAVVAAAAPAAASPDGDPTSGRAVFSGATLPSPTSIVLDPAALALARTELAFFAYGTGTLDQLSIDRKLLDVGTGAVSAGPRVHQVIASPGTELGVLWRPTEKLAFGIEGRTAPAQQFLGGSQSTTNPLRYYTLGGSQREYQASVAISVKATNELLIGASITVDWTNVVLHFARDTALDRGHGPGGVDSDCGGAPCGVENPAAAERYDIDAWQHNPLGDGYVVNIGAMYQLRKNTWLAVAYHTPPGGETGVNNTLDGNATVRLAPRDGGTALRAISTVYLSEPVTLDAELRARILPALDLHVGGRWEDLSRNLGYDVRLYGTQLAGTDVPEWQERQRGFEDVLALWTGVEQVDTGQRWRVGGRVGFETRAVPDDKTTPITISPTSGTLDLGVQLRAGIAVFQLSYGLQYFPTVHVDKSAYDPRQRIECVDGGYDYSTDACQATRLGYALPTADGDYGRIEHAVRLGLRVELPDARVVVYGATGGVGRAVCEALRADGVTFAVAGRDAGAISALAARLGVPGWSARVDEGARLAAAFAGARVVVCAAGPLAETAAPIAAAAIAAGASYVDVGGEQPVMRALAEAQDAAARRTGVACVPGCGLDCAIGDLAAAWAASAIAGEALGGELVRDRPGVRAAEAAPLDEICVGYLFDELALSEAQQRAAFARVGARPVGWRRDRWEPMAGAGRRIELSDGERAAVPAAAGDAITIPRHVAAEIVHAFVSPTRRASGALGLLARALPLVPRAAAELLVAAPTSDAQIAATRFAIVADARRGFERARVVVRGTDARRTTAQIAAWIAARLATRTSGPVGVRAPAELVRADLALAELATRARLVVERTF